MTTILDQSRWCGVACIGWLICGNVLLRSVVADGEITARQSPPTVQHSLKSLQTSDGIHVSLVAQEPQVIDPIAARFDHLGRLWVVEMRDYPTGPKKGQDPDGRIVILSDADQDGVYESSEPFVTGLVFPTGIQPWRSGIIVTLAGKIEFMADTDNDGQCDRREVWFEGFSEGNEQLRANHPVLGPDGLVYVASGLRGGMVESRDARWSREKKVDLTGKDFAFDPRGGFFNAVPGNSQYGLTIDDFGHRIGCSNRNPAMEAVFGAEDMRLLEADQINLSVGPALSRDVSPSGPDSEVRPITEAWTTSNLHAGQFSAACGVIRGAGVAMPSSWSGDLFVCEPTGYLVQRQVVRRREIGWQAQRADEPKELLASRDSWFRPVDLVVSPDGSLLVVDMCRAVIEHPDWAPAELKNRVDERDGDQQGRIWRLVAQSRTPSERFSPPKSPQGWANWLSHENPFQRATASRKLMELAMSDAHRSDVVRVVKKSLSDDQVSAPGFARAMQWLASCDALDESILRLGLDHEDAQVKRTAARLVRHFPQEIDRLRQDMPSDPWVRFEFVKSAIHATTLSVPNQEAPGSGMLASTRQALLQAKHDPAWRTLADIMPPTLAAAVLQTTHWDGRTESSIRSDLVYRLARQAASIRRLAKPVIRIDQDFRLPDATGLEDSKGVFIAMAAGYAAGVLQAGGSPTLAPKWAKLAEETMRDKDAPLSLRRWSFELLTTTKTPCLDALRELSQRDDATVLRKLAIEQRLRLDRESMLAWLQNEISLLPTPLRVGLLGRMCGDPELAATLLSWMEGGSFPPSFLAPDLADRLLQHPDINVQKRAKDLLILGRKDRQALIGEYAGAIHGEASLNAGKRVFEQHCAACHRVGDIGTNVGPDISDSRTKSPASLLEAVLDPSAAIDAGYASYRWLTVDGEINSGILLQRNSKRVTVAVSGGQQLTLPTEDLERFEPTGKSLMPEGFERTLNVDAMRDLIGYLKGWRYQSASNDIIRLDDFSFSPQ